MSSMLAGSSGSNTAFARKNTFSLPQLKIGCLNIKPTTIRPDSPRTREACQELGIDTNQLVLRDINDFGSDGCSEEIKKLRYDHYLERLQQDVKDVQERRLYNIKTSRMKMLNAPVEAQQQQMIDAANARKSIVAIDPTAVAAAVASVGSKRLIPQQNSTSSPFGAGKSLTDSHMSTRQMKNLYSKTVGYLRNSHSTPKVEAGEDVLGVDEPEGKLLESQLLNEIDKYNRLKEQKQKEAKILYEEDIERLQTIERMKEKDMRLIEQTLKMKKTKDLKKEELKKAAEEKGQKVKQMEQKYNQQKRDERERIRKRLEIIKERQQKDNEEREKLKREQEEREQEKLQKMDQIRISNREELIKNCDAQQELIQQKLSSAQEMQRSILMSKVNEMREKLDEEALKVQKVKDWRASNEKQQLSKLVQKLVEKEEHQKIMEAADIKDEMEKKKALKAKAETTQSVKQKVKIEQNSKITELKQKFEKIESNLQKKRFENEERIKLKQELRQLKEQDKSENNQRKKRRDDYRLEKLMEKEKQHADKIAYLKEQQELLRKAKQEVSQQTKLESERIFDCVKKVTNTLFPNIGANSKSSLYNIPPENKEKGVNLLKSIFRKDQLDMSIFEPPVKEEVVKKQP